MFFPRRHWRTTRGETSHRNARSAGSTWSASITVDKASVSTTSREGSGGAKRRWGENWDTRWARWRRSSQLSPSWSARWEISAYRRIRGRSRSSKTSISRTTNRALTDLQSRAFLIVWGWTWQRCAVSLRSRPLSDIRLAKSRPRRGASSGGFPEDLGCDFPSSTAAIFGGKPSVGGSNVPVAQAAQSLDMLNVRRTVADVKIGALGGNRSTVGCAGGRTLVDLAMEMEGMRSG